MTACLCTDCTDTPAPTYLESWRAMCEARMVAALPDHEARAGYLAGVAKSRGTVASADLRAAAKAVFDAMRRRKAA